MIINHNYRYLFVHIQKTAGTSISNILGSQAETKILFNHHTLMKDISLTALEISYFKFAFVRNPWDRLYSWYNMTLHKGPINKFHAYTLKNSDSFSEFLNCLDIIEDDIDAFDKSVPYYKSIAFNQLDYISDQTGKLNVDFIGRFESLNDDFQSISERLGLMNIKLPHSNKFDHNNYRSYYSDNDAEKVAKIYQRDIEYFKYQF